MKKSLFNLLSLSLLLTLASANVYVYAADRDVATYSMYTDFTPQEIREEYLYAIEAGDVEKQNILLEIADDRLEKSLNFYKSRMSTRAIYGNEDFYDLFTEGSFIYRYVDRFNAYGYSLSLNPDLSGPIFSYNWTDNDIPNSWDVVVAKYKNDWRWNGKNMDVMYKQYACHYGYGSSKTPWNLEVDATSMNPITCN